MNEVLETLDGWYCLHGFYKIDWTLWKSVSQQERDAAIKEFDTLLQKANEVENAAKGSHALYTIVGQKADLLIMVLRPTMKELNLFETDLEKTKLAEFFVPTYSYVSVVELTNYLEKGVNPYENPAILSRLYPILPKSSHICFYPMDKRRSGEDNWYMLPMVERRKFMASHGRIGRNYTGLVKQIVTGSMGFDDWEWGVTLFSDDVLQFKKIVYEMRFDEVSARFGEFGSFYVGNILEQEQIPKFLEV